MSMFLKGWTNVTASRSALLALVLVAAAATPAAAQSKLDFDLRAGGAIPAGDLNEVSKPGASVGVGGAYQLGDRLAFRVDGDLELLSERELADGVIMPKAYLWHYHAGLELDVMGDAESMWRVRLRGGAGGTTYDTKLFQSRNDDFLDTFFSVSGGLSVGRQISDGMELGVIGQAYVTFTDKDRTAEFVQESSLLNEFSKASSFPIQLYLRWTR